MNDYTIKIIKNGKAICAFGGHNMNYDNVLWWQLSELLKILKEGFNSKKELVEKVEQETDYFREDNDYDETTPEIDLDNQTISLPFFPIYKLNEVSKENCCIDLEKNNDEFYAVYDEDEKYKLEKVLFRNLELLKKNRVSFEEFKLISSFVDELLSKGETDYLLNNKFVVRFNCI